MAKPGSAAAPDSLAAHDAHHGTLAPAIVRGLSRLGLTPQLVRDALLCVVVSRVGFVVLTIVATAFLHPFGQPPYATTFLEAWFRWDAVHYAEIARDGYTASMHNAAFFPLQPALLALAAPLFGDNLALTGIVLSNLCFFGALLGVGALASHDFDLAPARRAMLYFTIFPTALFFFAGYAESVFLALAVWCVVALRRGAWWQAGVLGLLAALTRQMGLFLVFPFAYAYAQQAGWRLRAVRPNAGWILLIPAGLLLFMGWLWRTLGDPLAFVHVETYWTHTLTAPWTTLYRAVTALSQMTDPIAFRKGLVDLGAVVLVAVLIVRGLRKLKPGDLLYSAAVWLIAVAYPTTVWWLQSDSRYMLAAFPCFVLLAWEGRRRWLHILLVVVFVAGLILLTQYFVRGAVIL